MNYNDLFEHYIALEPDPTQRESALSQVPVGPGVAVLCSGNDQPITVLTAGNLRNVVQSRLKAISTETPSRRVDLSEICTGLWVVHCGSMFAAGRITMQAVELLFADRFSEFFPRLKLHMLTMDPSQSPWDFTVTDRFDPKRPLRYWGPIPSAKAATACLEHLRTMFNLCRCPERLRSGHNLRPCAYGQMNRCGAMCTGEIPLESYEPCIRRACDFLDDPVQSLDAMTNEMKVLAADRAFEQAGKLKQRRSAGEQIVRQASGWFDNMMHLGIVIFQPGLRIKIPGQRAHVRTVQPFILSVQGLACLTPFTAKKGPAACSEIMNHIALGQFTQSHRHSEPICPSLRSQRSLAWCANWLNYKKDSKGLFLRVESLGDTETLWAQVSDYFFTDTTETAPDPAKKSSTTAKPALDTTSLEQADQTSDPAHEEKS